MLVAQVLTILYGTAKQSNVKFSIYPVDKYLTFNHCVVVSFYKSFSTNIERLRRSTRISNEVFDANIFFMLLIKKGRSTLICPI